MMRIRKIAEYGWFDVVCIDCIDLQYLEENLKGEGERLVNKKLGISLSFETNVSLHFRQRINVTLLSIKSSPFILM